MTLMKSMSKRFFKFPLNRSISRSSVVRDWGPCGGGSTRGAAFVEGFANVCIEVVAKAFFDWLVGLGTGGLGFAGSADDWSCIFGTDDLIFLARRRRL